MHLLSLDLLNGLFGEIFPRGYNDLPSLVCFVFYSSLEIVVILYKPLFLHVANH